eukprot:gene14361-biopygen23115
MATWCNRHMNVTKSDRVGAVGACFLARRGAGLKDLCQKSSRDDFRQKSVHVPSRAPPAARDVCEFFSRGRR